MANQIPPEALSMLIASMTQQGKALLREIEVERFLNALARANTGVPTGVPQEPHTHA